MKDSKSKADIKTNVMRILDKAKINYEYYTYDGDGSTTGVQVAQMLQQDPRRVFKTLVTVGKSKNYYVFVIPVAEEIDFKKAARVVGEKSLEMLPLKDLTTVTGYIRGGCTSVGMKKKFKTTIQEDAMLLEKIVVSGGRRGLQLVLKPDDLLVAAEAEYADVIVDK